MTFRPTHLLSSPQPRLDGFPAAAASTSPPLTEQAISIFRSTETDIKSVAIDLEETKTRRRWSCGQLARRNMRSALGRISHTFKLIGNQLLANSGMIGQIARRVYSIQHGVLPFYATKICALVRGDSKYIMTAVAVNTSIIVGAFILEKAHLFSSHKLEDEKNIFSNGYVSFCAGSLTYRIAQKYFGESLIPICQRLKLSITLLGAAIVVVDLANRSLSKDLPYIDFPFTSIMIAIMIKNLMTPTIIINLGDERLKYFLLAENVIDRFHLGIATLAAATLPAIARLRYVSSKDSSIQTQHIYNAVALLAIDTIWSTGRAYLRRNMFPHVVRRDRIIFRKLEIKTDERLRERIINATLLEVPRVHTNLVLEYLNHGSQQHRRDAAAVMIMED